jgi:hypothetical protein
MTKTRNRAAQDATLIQVRAAKKHVANLRARVGQLEQQMVAQAKWNRAVAKAVGIKAPLPVVFLSHKQTVRSRYRIPA